MPRCGHLSPLSSVNDELECESVSYKCPSDFSLIESTSSGFVDLHSRTNIVESRKPPNIAHELNVAKSLMQQGSSLTGDNLFDHLAEIIKRVMHEGPENIIDYLEEFSYNVREQKFRIAEKFSWAHYEPPDVEAARKFFRLMKLPTEIEFDVCRDEKSLAFDSSLGGEYQRKLLLNENVLRLHLYWALCGFGFLMEEVHTLAYALQKIQFQSTIQHARFWGKIYGLKKNYYIVEAMLTNSETEIRLDKMRDEMMEMMCRFRGSSEEIIPTEVDWDLIPGFQWQESPMEELQRMKPQARSIPTPKVEVKFDIPPEAIGTGLNRRTYFVVNSLDEEWIELPIVTPKQIEISRQIKKFLTGDLEADIVSYPSFPGTEKHYLRAMIARITSGTYVAPDGYYRKLTKRERMEALGEDLELLDEEDEYYFEDEGEEEIDNDALITENSEYKPNPAELMTPQSWVHVRPNILDQGRVVYFDEIAARKALENESKLRLRAEEEMIEEDEDEAEGNEEGLIEEDDKPKAGPALFTTCFEDLNEENVEAWAPRKTSDHNKISQGIMMRSNLWPGAFSFVFDKYCDSIYLGLGFKYTARNMNVPQIPPIEDEFWPDYYAEITDPTVEMEEAWKAYQERKRLRLIDFVEEEVEEETGVC